MLRPFPVAFTLAASLLVTGMAIPHPAAAQDPSDWIGRIVYPASGSARLTLPGKIVAEGARIESLRVEKVNGPWLWATSGTATGWILATDVVPLDRAVDHYTAQLRADPGNAVLYYWRGEVHRERGQIDDAIADFTEAIRLNPRDSSSYVGRGRCWSKKKDYQNAIADATEGIRLGPTESIAYNNRGVYYQRIKEYDRALADYSEAIRRDPLDALFHSNRGQLKPYRLSNPDGALADLDTAIRLRPTFAMALSNRGDFHLDNDNLTSAAADYTKAIHYDPANHEAYAGRAEARRRKKDLDGALSDAGEAIRINPKSAYAYRARAKARADKGDLDGTLADFDEAIRIDRKDADSYNDRARIRATYSNASFRDGKRAVEDATKACELTDWKSASEIDTLAAALAEAGDFDAAIRRQTEAIEKLPKDAKNRGEYEAHLTLFRSRTPVREPSTPPSAVAMP